LHLLLAHPSLAVDVDEDTQGLLAGATGFELVSQLISLVRESGAQHVGAIAQAAADTPLATLVRDMAAKSLTAAELPDPPAEWRDACRTLELRVLQARQSALIASGMADDDARKQYMELSVQIASLKKKMAEAGDSSS
jgi:DNA primase